MASISTVGGYARTKQLPSSTIFKINHIELKSLFDRETPQSTRLESLARHGNIEGILSKLQTEADSGIMGDQGDLRRRQTKYSKNERPKPQRPPFFESVKDALNDRLILLVAIFALVSMIPGMIVEPSTGWVEGVFIIVALFIGVLISAWMDHSKDSKFVELQSLNRNEEIPVLRGKAGSTQTISVWKLVVGDIVTMQPGDKVPADCIIIDSANLQVNEIKRIDQEDQPTIFEEQRLYKNKNDQPFLYADSFILRGTCKALVACVGENSTRGIEDTTFDTSEQQTELTDKLDNIGGTLRFFGLLSSLVILATSLIVIFIQKGVSDEFKGDEFTKKLVDNIIIALIMLIVSVPEGLPMTVAVSLAYSVLLMKDYDNILVRDLESVEQVGLIQELCLGKTGTMTTEEMEVVNFYTQDIFVLNSRKNTFQNCDLDPMIQEKIIESICYNSQAYIEMTENSFYVPIGNGTEISLIKWLQAAEIPVHEIMQSKQGRVLAQVPFDSKLKRSIVAVRHPEIQDTVRIYIKGAPEIVINNCSNQYKSSHKAEHENADGTREIYQVANKVPLNDMEKQQILSDYQESRMAIDSFRTLAFSYCDMSVGEFQRVMDRMHGDIDAEEEIRHLEQNQTFLAMVALKDPLRNNMKDVVTSAQKCDISLRVVSGDHLLTTSAVACDIGILTKDEFDSIKAGNGGDIVMDAKQFRQICGDVIRNQSEIDENENQTTTYSLAADRQRAFNDIISNLKVIGRAEPEDKLRLVAGLSGMRDDELDEDDEEENAASGRKVGIVGEGINDIEAFDAATVSFALGSGTSLARNKASMVLTTNDFESSMRAVMWGRNIYVNVQRFLQFQMTCNLAVITVVMVSTITMTESCLNAVQLIYINLIMDILGAIALASTRPNTEVSHEVHSTGKLITPFMYRQIFGVALYMIAIMMVIMYSGKKIFHLEYDAHTPTIEKSLAGEHKMEHFTLIWNCFVFLQFFNLINCRDVSAHKMHGFSQLHRNFSTIFVLLIIIGVSVFACFTFLGRAVFEASKQDGREYLITIVMGASVLLINCLLKFIPDRWVAKMPSLDESKSVGSNNALMNAYNKQAQAKAFQKKGAAQAAADDDQLSEVHSQDRESDGYQHA